jgi:hypothetical protein
MPVADDRRFAGIMRLSEPPKVRHTWYLLLRISGRATLPIFR